MASTTPNLNLKLLGTSLTDKETQFEEWRTDINGEGGSSNMSKIDTAFGQMSSTIDTIQRTDVTNVSYDANSKKLQKTINGSTTDVFDATALPLNTETQTALNTKSGKDETVTAVSYDSSNKKITQTINGLTSDVVGVGDIAEAMDVITDEQIDALFDE